MRNVSLDDVDHLPVDVLPIGTDYPPGYLLPRHSHRRAQLLYGASGTMLVETDDGSWTVPTDRAVLIPPGTAHEVHMLSVSTWSLYIEPDAVPWWPARCTVVDIGPLLRELLRAANELPADYDVDGRDGAVTRLALYELRRLSPLPTAISLPRNEPYRSLCRAYLAAPDVSVTNDDWARTAATSTRSLDRHFRAETGSSPAAWRAKARLLAGLPLLQTMTVTQVAAHLGYASPAAFTAAFTRTFHTPPSAFTRGG
ncbi:MULTISPECIES: AraC family transcriptional regulator [Streptomyces]|uniref:Transcriptional regulator n=1 Tax=Streptomyces cacaoi TaxID=1898 RepID=A0A4Y3QXQ8_STRCI|nr:MULTISPECIES: helix-turn-helix transcriptional regulator [Streptomyces]NNG85497.1 helix-turn-helix transcriptional regulator [Streptomyces cacaoi]QHF93727.1 AraC family transcriptional regulator [Streptomyces sp. NHF165]GEB50185.1 transcriptional regulator [Streptomyces cacaoi]